LVRLSDASSRSLWVSGCSCRSFSGGFLVVGIVGLCMARRSPLDAALWQGLIDKGEVRCRGCDTFVDLEDADDINEGVEIWNEHVADCPASPEPTDE